ncbi:MAG: ABC transporter substrate-binding protein, partial [Clostridia bacterium]|nr:ABC transporter substrate-binding protein [Clostridia bacterium]
MKKLISVVVCLVIVLSAFAVGESVKVAALNGPTGMGMVKLMKDEEGKENYEFTLAGSPDMLTPSLIKGELDIACVP